VVACLVGGGSLVQLFFALDFLSYMTLGYSDKTSRCVGFTDIMIERKNTFPALMLVYTVQEWICCCITKMPMLDWFISTSKSIYQGLSSDYVYTIVDYQTMRNQAETKTSCIPIGGSVSLR
jgi:hypothetical protein